MLHSLLQRLRSWWAVEDADERIEGAGDVYLDPAYNGRYTAERRLQKYSGLTEERDDGPSSEQQ